MRDIITVRASSMPDLFDCPARWEAKHIKGLWLPSSGNAVLGKAVHAGTAAYDKAELEGSPIIVSDAVGVAIDTIYKPDEEIDWGEDRPQEAESIGIALTDLYCRSIAPDMSYVAVEATCERLEITDIGLALTGTTDRVVSRNGDFGIADIKTGKNAVGADGKVNTKGHASQMAVYELLAEHSTGMHMDAPAQIIGLQVAKTDKGRRANVGQIVGGRDLLLGDEEFPGLLQHAANMIHSGTFPGNPKSMMCHSKYCPVYNNCRWRR